MSVRVLVVDDNVPSLRLVTYLLRAFGYEPEGASNAAAALEAAQHQTYDLVLTDIRMPEVDGYELARRIRAIPGFERTPLVAVTALAMVGDRDAVLASGFDGYISKPINPDTFAAQIRSFLPKNNGQDSRR